MDNTSALRIFMESIIGKSTSTGKGNYSFKCCFCNHHKNKLEINLNTTEKGENLWHCWVCGKKGKNIISLLNFIGVDPQRIKEFNIINGSPSQVSYKQSNPGDIKLPSEFISLNHPSDLSKIDRLEVRRALAYLKKRNINQEDILKYNIGICLEGKYNERVIIPSYDKNGTLNYFIARAYTDGKTKYKNPPISNNVIGWELYINWDAPIILCEGIFDALTIKRNVIPLFGKVINNSLMAKLVESSVNKIYIALDKDAIKDALKYCETLMNYGKKIYLVDMKDKDISEMGFDKTMNVLENTFPLTFSDLINKKLSII